MEVGIWKWKNLSFALKAQNQKLVRLDFIPVSQCICNANDLTPFLQDVCTQLDAYFEKRLFSFDVSYSLQGTEFQKEVWQALSEIPYGQSVSYQDIAQKINRPQAMRAVGQAVHFNPIPIIVPCHRVIPKNGGVGGYAGGVELKKFLLKLEGII